MFIKGDQFTIDKNKVLGKGGFGCVYQGTLFFDSN